MSKTRSTEIRNYSAASSNTDDFFVGTEGRDIFDGQGGNDTVSYKNSRGGVTVDLNKGYGHGGNASGDTYVSIENAIGSHQADKLFGNAVDNVLKGLGGDDELYGFAGDDTLIGGAGDDHLEGGAGADVIDGGDGIDTVSYRGSDVGVNIDLTAGTAAGTQAYFDVDGNLNAGFAHGDVITNVENVIGSTSHDDVLKGDAGDNMLDGWGGDDTLVATLGNDTIIGGAGTDTVDYSQLTSRIDVDLGEGWVYKWGAGQSDQLSSVEVVIGTDHNDEFTGTSGANILFGGAGNDKFWASSGADYYDGGAGIDEVSYQYASHGIQVDLEIGAQLTDGPVFDTYVGIENIAGSAYDDILVGDSENNRLTGGSGNDVLIGGDGDDVLIGGQGSDQIDGGEGFDRLVMENHDNADLQTIINLETGSVTLINGGVASVNDETFTGIEAIEAIGTGFTLIGDDADNLFIAHGAGTEVQAGGGNDTIDRRAFDGTLDGGEGNDTVDYTGSWQWFGESPNDGNPGLEIDLAQGVAMRLEVDGQLTDTFENIENVVATAFDDVLTGDDADNVLNGSYGDDIIDGGRGSDILIGGQGADIFVFVNRQNDPDQDVIADFQLGFDLIDFSDNDNYIDDFEEMLDNADQVGADVVIDTGQGTVTLEGVQLTALSEDDFLF